MGEKELTQYKFMCLQAASGDIEKAKEILTWILEKPVKEEPARVFSLTETRLGE